MNESSGKFFEAVKLYNEGFFWDAIEAFQQSLSDGLEDNYVDDCFLNIAVCYMQLHLFDEAAEFFKKAIDAAQSSGDKIDFQGPIYGKTSDRAKLGLARISLAKNDLNGALTILKQLEDSESYIEIDDEKILMYDICAQEIESAKSKLE